MEHVRCEKCKVIHDKHSYHFCNAAEARLGFSYPFYVDGRPTIGTHFTVREGRVSKTGGGFATTESELRSDFEHFITDLKLLKVLK